MYNSVLLKPQHHQIRQKKYTSQMAENSILSNTLFTLAKTQRSNSSLSPSSRVSKTKDDINLSQHSSWFFGFCFVCLCVCLLINPTSHQNFISLMSPTSQTKKGGKKKVLKLSPVVTTVQQQVSITIMNNNPFEHESFFFRNRHHRLLLPLVSLANYC
jgi:hypothetical protein